MKKVFFGEKADKDMKERESDRLVANSCFRRKAELDLRC